MYQEWKGGSDWEEQSESGERVATNKGGRRRGYFKSKGPGIFVVYTDYINNEMTLLLIVWRFEMYK